jgi:hypothetical protein
MEESRDCSVLISACTLCYFLGPGVPKWDRAVQSYVYLPTLFLTFLLCRPGVARKKSNPRTDFPLLSHLIAERAPRAERLSLQPPRSSEGWLVTLAGRFTQAHEPEPDAGRQAHARTRSRLH